MIKDIARWIDIYQSEINIMVERIRHYADNTKRAADMASRCILNNQDNVEQFMWMAIHAIGFMETDMRQKLFEYLVTRSTYAFFLCSQTPRVWSHYCRLCHIKDIFLQKANA